MNNNNKLHSLFSLELAEERKSNLCDLGTYIIDSKYLDIYNDKPYNMPTSYGTHNYCKFYDVTCKKHKW